MYDRIPAQSVESVPGPKQAESKICTELGKNQGQVKCSSGLGIISKKEKRKENKERKKKKDRKIKKKKENKKKKETRKKEKKKKRNGGSRRPRETQEMGRAVRKEPFRRPKSSAWCNYSKNIDV